MKSVWSIDIWDGDEVGVALVNGQMRWQWSHWDVSEYIDEMAVKSVRRWIYRWDGDEVGEMVNIQMRWRWSQWGGEYTDEMAMNLVKQWIDRWLGGEVGGTLTLGCGEVKKSEIVDNSEFARQALWEIRALIRVGGRQIQPTISWNKNPAGRRWKERGSVGGKKTQNRRLGSWPRLTTCGGPLELFTAKNIIGGLRGHAAQNIIQKYWSARVSQSHVCRCASSKRTMKNGRFPSVFLS